MPEYAERYMVPCDHWIGSESRVCGATPTRRFLTGVCCLSHTPAKVSGHVEPPKPDPAMTLDGRRAAAGLDPHRSYTPAGDTAIDDAAKASGKRRSSPAEHRAARDRQAAHR